MAEYEDLRQRHLVTLMTLMPEHVQRLRWPADRLRQERRDRLRDLLRVARASSPWHRERLAGVAGAGVQRLHDLVQLRADGDGVASSLEATGTKPAGVGDACDPAPPSEPSPAKMSASRTITMPASSKMTPMSHGAACSAVLGRSASSSCASMSSPVPSDVRMRPICASSAQAPAGGASARDDRRRARGR